MFAIGDKVWPGTSKVIEECGELLQVLGKLIANGGKPDHWDGTNLHHRLVEELADVFAALTFFMEINGLDRELIEERAKLKLERFHKWHRREE